MDLRQLESFVRVAELGSFSRASAIMDIPQPSLSRHVAQLEQEIRNHLFVRTGRGVEPTEAGKRLLTYAQAMLELERQAYAEMDAIRGQLTGRVTIGLPPRVAQVLTPVLVKQFRQRFPLASIAVSEGLSTALREDLILGRLELAVLFDPPPSPRLECRSLFQEELVLCGQPTRRHPLPERLAVADLTAYPAMVPSRPNAIRMLIDTACRSRGIELDVVAEVDSVKSLLQLAVDGQGYAIVPESAARTVSSPTWGISAIDRPVIRNDMVLAYSRQRLLSRLGQATFDLVVDQDVGALLAAGEARRPEVVSAAR